MLAVFAIAHLIIVPAMLDSFREFGLIAPPATQLALSTTGLLIVELPGVVLVCGAAVSLLRGDKKRGGMLIALCVLLTFVASVFFVYSLSLPRPATGVTPAASSASGRPNRCVEPVFIAMSPIVSADREYKKRRRAIGC